MPNGENSIIMVILTRGSSVVCSIRLVFLTVVASIQLEETFPGQAACYAFLPNRLQPLPFAPGAFAVLAAAGCWTGWEGSGPGGPDRETGKSSCRFRPKKGQLSGVTARSIRGMR